MKEERRRNGGGGGGGGERRRRWWGRRKEEEKGIKRTEGMFVYFGDVGFHEKIKKKPESFFLLPYNRPFKMN